MRDHDSRLRVLAVCAIATAISWLVFAASERNAEDPHTGDRTWARAALLEIATPFQKAIEFPLEIAGDVWRNYLALVEVRANNEKLRERIAILESENLQFREALIESDNLDRIGQMRSELATPMRPAQVVGQDISPWFRSVLLDRGQRDRVRSGMPVIVEQGLVGLVTASTPNAARTMLLPDTQSAVDAIVQRSRARGIVRGGHDGLHFEFYVRGDDVAVGDAIMTSGFGGVYPKGLRIGQVSEVFTDEEQLVHYATVEPAVDFGRLEQVFVLLWRGPSIELLYHGDGDLEAGPTP